MLVQKKLYFLDGLSLDKADSHKHTFVRCKFRTRAWNRRAKNFLSILGKSKRFFSSPKDPGWLQIQRNWQRDFYSGR